MKLVRYGPAGHERPGLLDAEGRIRDLSSIVADIDPDTLGPVPLGRLRGTAPATLPIVGGSPRLGVPISGIGKVVAIGLNYTDHAAEAGMATPAEPVLFLKAATSLCGAHDPVLMPPDAGKLDWEVELACVIGSICRSVSEDTALEHVAGYATFNDLSDRGWQLEGTGQWTKGKSADTFGPLGPWLVTADEVASPQNLALWNDVNGHRYQDGWTGNMIFSMASIIAFVSSRMTLMPGDVIVTGTPKGVGLGQKPPVYLQAGDILTCGVEGLGHQRHEIIAQAARSGVAPAMPMGA